MARAVNKLFDQQSAKTDEANPDLSGFPLLRLDQLHCMQIEILRQSLSKLCKQILINGGSSHGENTGQMGQKASGPFCAYARRQIDAMIQEMHRRKHTINNNISKGVFLCQLKEQSRAVFRHVSGMRLPAGTQTPTQKPASPRVIDQKGSIPPFTPSHQLEDANYILLKEVSDFYSSAIHFSRPKNPARGGRYGRAPARARMQQYNAWRRREKGESERVEAFHSKQRALSPRFTPTQTSYAKESSCRAQSPISLQADSCDLKPTAPIKSCPTTLLVPITKPSSSKAHFTSNHLPWNALGISSQDPPSSDPKEEVGSRKFREQASWLSLTTRLVSSSDNFFYFRLGSCSGRSEVRSILIDVFEMAFPDWRRWPQDDDDRKRNADAFCEGNQTAKWHLLWTWGKSQIKYASLLAGQRVNHIPGSRELTRKDLLVRHLTRYLLLCRNASKRGLESAPERQAETLLLSAPEAMCVVGHEEKRDRSFFDIMPQTFALPHSYTSFLATFHGHAGEKKTKRSKNIWVLKPVESSRGRGIKVLNDLSQLLYCKPAVIQRYVTHPFLLDGFKFDLRLYVLVTSFQPSLEAFLYVEGFARFCTAPFQLHDLDDHRAHISNSSVQTSHTTRDSPLPSNHPLCVVPPMHVGGSKLRLTYLWYVLENVYKVNTATLWNDIGMLVLKSLVCVEDSIPPQPGTFELFGFDVLLDSDLRPWLLEVNSSPSLAREYTLDHEVKETLLVDTINVVMQRGGLGKFQRLCPNTENYRRVKFYRSRFLRNQKGKIMPQKTHTV